MNRFPVSKVVSGAVWVAIGTALIKLFGAVREILLARSFGAGDEVDTFVIAIAIPAVVVLIFGLAFQSAFVPAYVRAVRDGGVSAGRQLFAEVCWITLGGVAILTVVTGAVGYVLVDLLGSNFDQDKLARTRSLFMWFLPLTPLACVGTMMSAVLNGRERFFRAAVVPVITPLVVIAFLVFPDTPDIRLIVNAVVLGSAIELLIFVVLVNREGFHLQRLSVPSPRTRAVFVQAMPLAIMALLTNVNLLVDQGFAATQGEGAVASLIFGGRVPLVILAILAAALGTVVLPALSRLAAEGRANEVATVVFGYAWRVFAFLTPIVVLLVMATPLIIDLLYGAQRFDTGIEHSVERAQQFYLLQVPFFAVNVLGLRALSALLDNFRVMFVSIVGLAVNVVADYFLVDSLGPQGAALGSSIVQIALLPLIAAMLIYGRKHGQLHIHRDQLDEQIVI